jgi:hypothetical protein
MGWNQNKKKRLIFIPLSLYPFEAAQAGFSLRERK